jgi:beta-lactamase regulating signal transducer with metallopeptidase domain
MIGWLLETLLGVTMLMLLVLAVRRPVARFCGAGWAYALWLLPAARVLTAFIPSFSLPSAAAFIPAMDGVAAPLPVESGPGQWVPFMLATWAGGAVTFLIWHWLNYRAFLNAVKAHSKPGDPPVYGGIETLASEAVDGPLALGLFERRIVLPWNFARRYDAGERRLAMEHELVHHRRGDIAWNMAGLFILAANWFNPVAWFAFHAFRSDQELACDAAVAKRASAGERHDYARALVKSASRPGLIAACPLNPADELKHRLRMIRAHRSGRARMAGGAAAFASLLAGGLALSSPGRPGAAEPAFVESAMAATSASTAAPALALAAAAPSPAPAPKRAAIRPRLAAHPSAPAHAAPLIPLVPGPEMQLASSVDYARSVVRFTVRHAYSPPEMLAAAASRPHDGELLVAAVRPARIVTFRVEGGIRIVAAPGAGSVQLTEVQAALYRAMAESNDEATRANLGRAVGALEQRIRELGMITTID